MKPVWTDIHSDIRSSLYHFVERLSNCRTVKYWKRLRQSGSWDFNLFLRALLSTRLHTYLCSRRFSPPSLLKIKTHLRLTINKYYWSLFSFNKSFLLIIQNSKCKVIWSKRVLAFPICRFSSALALQLMTGQLWRIQITLRHVEYPEGKHCDFCRVYSCFY